MAVKTWQTIKVRYCEHAGKEVALEAETVYPSEQMPDQPPQIRAHRCSHGMFCAMNDSGFCKWAGANPLVDPFEE